MGGAVIGGRIVHQATIDNVEAMTTPALLDWRNAHIAFGALVHVANAELSMRARQPGTSGDYLRFIMLMGLNGSAVGHADWLAGQGESA